MKKHLIIYAKKPLPGYAKTRLGSIIGFEESAGVYARFLYQSLFELIELTHDEITIELSLASDSDKSFFNLAFPEFVISSQLGSDLGQRFTQSFKDAFDNGADSVVVIGSDIPDLDRSIIQAAFKTLEGNDVVIGPDRDGGYYLFGTRERNSILFQDINWSSEFVLQQTKRLLQGQQITFHLLPVLSDVDTYTDYQRWLSTMN